MSDETTLLLESDRFAVMLGERGITCLKNDCGCDFWIGGKKYTIHDNICGTLNLLGITPEQAVAVTLGSDDEYEAKMDALLCRLTNGKWSKSRAYDLDFMVSCVDEEYEELYEKERAELESGTCELAYGEDDEGYDGWYCQSCGGWFDAVRRDGKLVEPMRCGCCGKAVKR